MRFLALPLVLALAVLFGKADAQSIGTPFKCGTDGTGATLTELTGCPVLSQTQQASRYYIHTIITQSTTATAGLFRLRSGTGTNCGTATAEVVPVAGTAARLASPANTAPPNIIKFAEPVPVTPGHALCVLGVATNLTQISVYGFIAP